MTGEPRSFEVDTSVEEIGDGTFKADLHRSWSVWGGIHGGYLAGIAADAMASGSSGPLRSLSSTFLRPGSPGEAIVDTASVHAGTTLRALTATASQEEVDLLQAHATFGAPGKGPGVNAEPPEIPRWEEADPFDPPPAVDLPSFTQHAEYRIAGGELPFGGTPGGKMRVWIRMRDPVAYRAPLLVYLVDAWMPATFTALDRPTSIPTIQLDVHLPSQSRPDPKAPVLGVFWTEQAADGYAIEAGELWSPSGNLLALGRQARIFRDPPTP